MPEGLTNEEKIEYFKDTIVYLENRIKAKIVNSEDRKHYKRVIQILKAKIKQLQK